MSAILPRPHDAHPRRNAAALKGRHLMGHTFFSRFDFMTMLILASLCALMGQWSERHSPCGSRTARPLL